VRTMDPVFQIHSPALTHHQKSFDLIGLKEASEINTKKGIASARDMSDISLIFGGVAKIWFGFMAVAWIASSYLLLSGGYPYGHDWIQELVRVSEFQSALIRGEFPPVWGENLYHGFGSPIFLFYAPLFLAITSVIAFFVRSFATAAVISILGLTAVSMILMYRLARNAFDSPRAGRIAAYLFILHPYLLGDKLIRCSFAEFTALCVAPMPILGWIGIVRSKSYPRAAWFALSIGMALMILAHNLFSLFLFAGLFIATVIHGVRQREWKKMCFNASALSVGLLLSFFFWAPALVYKNLVSIDFMTLGTFHYSQNFPSLLSLFDGSSHFSGGWLSASILCALLFLLRRRFDLIWLLLFSAGTLLFLMSSLSSFLWGNLPLLGLFQFPWRFMGFLAILTALAGALITERASRRFQPKILLAIESMILVVAILNAVPVFRRYQSVPTDLSEKLEASLRPDVIRLGRNRATVTDEYLPQWADGDLWKERISTAPVDRWYFPDLRVSVQGVLQETFPAKDGRVAFRGSDRPANPKFVYRPPALRRWGVLVSLLTFIGLGVFFLRRRC
jgi:uncharacterized membrane protein